MSDEPSGPPAGGAGRPLPSDRELSRMSRGELAELAAELEDVTVVSRTPKPPEKRSERAVLAWLVLSALSAVAFVVVYVVWPHDYVAPSAGDHTIYLFYTPLIGLFAGMSVLSLGIGAGLYVKRFVPDEIAVQRRHDGPSDDLTRRTATAQIAGAAADTGLGRRPLVRWAALGALGLTGVIGGVLTVGFFVRNPWKGRPSALRRTLWAPSDGETVYLRHRTTVSGEVRRVRPEDLQPGSMITVYPYRLSDGTDPERLHQVDITADVPVMLFRLQPGADVRKKRGQENFNHGDYYAFSAICTHLGCATPQYDPLDNISMCPCHQSEFLITEWARPVFGPADRALPQLPLGVDGEGFLIATGDFIEPVGPSFWELRSS